MKALYTIGIDEAGRGALAGPVVVAAVAVPKVFNHRRKHLPRLRDSKKLSSSQRDIWHDHLRYHPLALTHTSRVYQKRIDEENIAKSCNKAASVALQKILDKLELERDSVEILLDGNLYLADKDHLDLEYKTVVRGDEKIVSIKMASIVAKVTRDKYMDKLHDRYPEYDFLSHKGYGTSEHFKALKKHGISDIHRLTYLKGYPNLKPAKS